ncbi:MAG: tetratricopeptide repeat protein [Planctomycetota bacterium]
MGLDGADWRILDPLLKAGQLPHLATLIERGASGPLRSIEPLISPPIWTSIVTGVKPERHGITWFMSDTDRPERRVPVTSSLRKTKALWNILSEHERRVGVIGWWATFPAERVRGFVVSDFVGYHNFGNTGRSVENDLGKTYPPSLLDAIRGDLPNPDGIPDAGMRRFIEATEDEIRAGRRGEGRWGKSIQLFQTYLATAESYVRIAERACVDSPPELLAVYFELPDASSHLFARYANPRLRTISEEGHARFGKTVEEVYRRQDELLGALLGLVGPEAAVFVVSDHGFRWGDRRPAEGEEVQVGRAHLWHEIDGILIAAGPGIRRGYRIPKASVLDIAPTLLRYMDLSTARDMEGSVLVDLFEPPWIEAHPASTVETYETPLDEARRQDPDWAEQATGFAREQEERLAALGYLSRSGPSPEIRSARAAMLLQSGKYAEAEKELEELVRRSPADPSFRVGLAEVYRRTNRSLLARKEYEAAAALVPGDAGILCGLAEVLIEQGDLQAAEVWLGMAIEKSGGFARAHVDLGHLLNLQGRLEEAKEQFLRALEVNPRSFEALFNLGVLAEREGQADEAARKYRAAVEAEPNDPHGRMNLGVLLFHQGSRREGLELLVEAARIAPEEARVRYNLGAIYLDEGMSDKAVEELEAAVRADPDLHPAHLVLGRAYAARGQATKALQSLETAARLNSRDPEAPYAIALVEVALGRTDRAREALRRALDLGGAGYRSLADKEPRFAALGLAGR